MPKCQSVIGALRFHSEMPESSRAVVGNGRDAHPGPIPAEPVSRLAIGGIRADTNLNQDSFSLSVHARVCACVHTCTCVCACVHVHTHVCMRLCVCARVCVHLFRSGFSTRVKECDHHHSPDTVSGCFLCIFPLILTGDSNTRRGRGPWTEVRF